MPRGITTVFAALCLVGSALAVRARGGSREQPPAVRSERAAFAAWKVVHGVTYDSADEEEREFVQWLENDASIRSHNAAAVGWELGHNVYSSHSWEQFQWKMGIGLGERKQAREASPIGAEHRAGDYAGDTPALRATLEKARRAVGAASEAGREWESVLGAKLRAPSALLGTNPRVPESRDWVAEGGVSPVNNQANCGSCWSFAATGAVEGLFFATTGELLRLSPQNLLSCDYGPQAGRYRDNGCGGGLPDNAFMWIAHNGGVCLYDDAPYISGNGKQYACLNDCAPVVTVSGFRDVARRDELALLDAVAQQPVSVGIDASEYPFMLYKSGVLDTPKCGDRLDHAVLVVGYGTDGASGQPYWKVKNSWGTSWGEGGYVRMVRGKNMCGIAEMPSYPVGALRAPHRVSSMDLGDIVCSPPQDGDAMLTAYPAGSLLVYGARQWRTVCADTTAKTSASLACTLLGYKSAVMLTNKPAAGGPYNISAGLLCDGSEYAFDQCKTVPIRKDDWCADYPTEMAAYVKCYGLADGASSIAAGALKCGTRGWGGQTLAVRLAEAAPSHAVRRQSNRAGVGVGRLVGATPAVMAAAVLLTVAVGVVRARRVAL